MASEWYVQHGDKQYGPMSPQKLKKLAAAGKITPATLVRPGAQANWVPASKVQGLFTAGPKAAPAPRQQPSTAAVPKADPLAAPPRATPVPPPMAGGLAPPPWAKQTGAPRAKPTEGAAMGPKVLGAVAIIFGAVALTTFWLPVLGGPLGWTGIVTGGLGLLVGIAGLVVAATSGGAGLMLNIAGTSGSAVGLVLAVVLGVTFGLFSSAPEPLVVQRPAPPPVTLAKQEPPPVAEPEPEPPPEPEWTDASLPIEQGPIKATVVGVGIEQVRLESADLSTLRRQKPKPMLKIRLAIENTSTDKIVEVPGWIGGSPLGGELGAGLGELLKGSELGKAVQTSSATAKLTDNSGNNYKQTPTISLFGAQIEVASDYAVRPGKSRQVELVFPPPLETIDTLRLELPSSGFGGTDALRFEIPRAMISGLPAPAGG